MAGCESTVSPTNTASPPRLPVAYKPPMGEPNRMFKAIAPHTLGIHAEDLNQAIAAAPAGGFEGLELLPPHIVDLPPGEAARRLDAAGLRAAGFGLPIDFRGDAESFRANLKSLPAQVAALVNAGATRCYTWIMPCCDTRPLEENYAFHVERLRPVARILADHGCRFGLEFIGPVTLRRT